MIPLFFSTRVLDCSYQFVQAHCILNILTSICYICVDILSQLIIFNSGHFNVFIILMLYKFPNAS